MAATKGITDEAIVQALFKTEGNKAAAAKLLGVSPKSLHPGRLRRILSGEPPATPSERGLKGNVTRYRDVQDNLMERLSDLTTFGPRTCAVCHNELTPPKTTSFLDTDGNSKTHCASCRRAVKKAVTGEQPASEIPTMHTAAPLKQVVFDLETWGLDRGWGVTMVASFMFHGDGPVRMKTLTLREFEPWTVGRRSDDRDFAAAIFDQLRGNHIAYAHNGERFDVKWLRTVAMKYGLDMPKLKLIDPAQIGWKKYLVGRNSLEALADFLELPYKKYHIPPQVWRAALLDNAEGAWLELATRCESDVVLLNAVAAKVTNDVGMIDYQGSWR